MEGYTSENPAPLPDKSSPEKRGKKKAKKESFTDVLSKTFEVANKDEAAHKIAENPTIAESLLGKPDQESTKAEKKAAKKEAKKAEKAAKKEIVVPEPAAPEQIAEIPLDESAREIATEYIDLRGAEVSEAQFSISHDSGEATELAADATLLVHAREEVQDAPEGSMLNEAIDTAYDKASEAIAAGAEAAVVQQSAAAEALGPPPEADAALLAHLQNQEATTPAEKQAITPEAQVVEEAPSMPWYYNTDGSRRFYPGSWPPTPSKSPLEKVTDDVRASKERKDTVQTVKKEQKKQTEAIQSYIDTKEQAIRSDAAEAFAAIPRGYKSAPAEKFMWTPGAKSAEAVSQTIRSETTASQAAERGASMSQQELLRLSDSIIIDGTPLRSFYEARQITEPGLRRIAEEYVRGGEVKKALEHELLLKEMAYERDPQMRDRLAASYADLDAAAPQSVNDSFAAFHAQAAEPPRAQPTFAAPLATGMQQRGPSNEQVLTAAWGALITVLAIIATILLFR